MKKAIILIYLYIIIDYIELCYAYCHYLNIHEEHKVIPINDEETLKKETLSINII